jgi:hypothetical protein
VGLKSKNWAHKTRELKLLYCRDDPLEDWNGYVQILMIKATATGGEGLRGLLRGNPIEERREPPGRAAGKDPRHGPRA